MRVVIRAKFDPASRYLALCHELAHIYLGHLGTDADRWWPSRINLDNASEEIEAESVAHIVCARRSLETTSAPYLAPYLESSGISPNVSLELIAKTADRVLNMGVDAGAEIKAHASARLGVTTVGIDFVASPSPQDAPGI